MTNAKIAAWGLGSAAALASLLIPIWLTIPPVHAQSRGAQDSATIGKAPAAAKLQASILLQQSNRKLKEMPTDEMFYSGERFRLKLRSDRDGYLYVLLRDAQGQAQLIYPSAQDLDDTDNKIARNQAQSVPARDFFRFDETAGTERVWVVVAPRPLADLDRAARDGGELSANLFRHYTSAEQAGAKGIDREGAGDDDRDDAPPARNAAHAVLPFRIVHLPR